MTDNANTAIRDLMVANRILAHEGVVDAFGHISVRNPDNAGRYFLACSRSPGLVTEDDIVEFRVMPDHGIQVQRTWLAGRLIYAAPELPL